jgi:biofilm PGA synthesis N-glycosyltransferase PgaC
VPEPLAAFVVASGDLEALRASLEALSTAPSRTWCAVSTREEAAAAGGLARPVLMAPWPGARVALARLRAQTAPELEDGAAVVVLAAGTVLQRNFVAQASELLRSGAAIVVASDSRGTKGGWGWLGRFTSIALAHAVLAPTTGMVMRVDTLARLCDAGWLDGRELRLRQIRKLVGRVRVLRNAVASYPGKALPAWPPRPRLTVTVLIPAHNEEAWIGETLRSVRRQTLQPDEVIVVDDCSSDRTGEIAAHHGATVLRTPVNRLKASAQNYALRQIRTDVVMTLDADTILHPEAIFHLVADLEAGHDATNGAVMPQSRRGIWTRARLIEYAIAMRLHKRVQRNLGSVLVLSGCVSAFRTEVLQRLGGFQERTVTEDLDMTWSLHLDGYRVGYAPKALCYPAEPATWKLFKAQVRRWAAGMFQTIGVHGTALRRKRGLVLILAAALWDTVTSLLLLAVTVFVIVTRGFQLSIHLLILTVAITVVAPIVLATTVIGLRPAVVSFPAYFVGAVANQYFYVEALIREWVLRRRTNVWIKGH